MTKEVPLTALEVANLKRKFGRNPEETETEYVWRLSLNGGDQILPSEKEAEGHWGRAFSSPLGPRGAVLFAPEGCLLGWCSGSLGER